MFERIIARMQAAEPGQWVLKGGMALEVRLRDDARLTKDVDLGLRDDVNSAPDLHERLIDILAVDLDHDYFIFTAGPPERLRDDSGGVPTWRAKVSAQLADKPFGRIQLDVSPRTHELHATDRLAIPSSLAFAGIPTVEVEAVDIHRHAAEKFHGMLRDFGERENSRVRDLVDLAILLEHDLLEHEQTAAAVRCVWLERNNTEPPGNLPRLSRQDLFGVGGERGCDDRPGHLVVAGGLHDRAVRVGNRDPGGLRNLAVSRARAGTWGTCSVNVRRGHPGWSQCQRRLRHRSRLARPATGRSLGRVVTDCLTRDARTPQSGHCRACSSAVGSATIGLPPGSGLTRSTISPSRPSSRVVSLTMLAALHL